MLRKKMGVKMSATGLIRSSMTPNCFVSDRMSPAANAPMMSAVPARSARTQSSSRNAKADTTSTPRTRIRSTRPKSRGASFSPIQRATKRNATATPRMRSAPCRLNAVPAASPETTPRITSPMTSSITAAPRMRRASRLCSTWRSLSTRAVIPTEVAVSVAPTKMAVTRGSAEVCSYPCHPDAQYRKPKPNGTATPTAATAVAAAPTRIMALRSVSSPISNSSTTTPTCASSRNTGVSGSSAPIGITLRKPAPSRMPTSSSPITAGWPRRSNTSPANFPASNMIANTVKKRATSMPPAAPRTRGRPAARAHVGRLKRLRRLGMEVEGVVEQREVDGLVVLGLDHDLPRRRPSGDPDLLGLGREPDILCVGLDAAADRAVVERGGKLGLGLHFVEQAIVPEEQLTDVDAVVQRADQKKQRHETTGRAGAPVLYHCDCAPSTRSLTSFWRAIFRPATSWGGDYAPPQEVAGRKIALQKLVNDL